MFLYIIIIELLWIVLEYLCDLFLGMKGFEKGDIYSFVIIM